MAKKPDHQQAKPQAMADEGLADKLRSLLAGGEVSKAGGGLLKKAAKALKGAQDVLPAAAKPSAGPAFGGWGFSDDLLRRERGSFASSFGVDYGQALAPSFEFVPVKRLNTTEKVDEAKVRSLMRAMKDSGNTLDNKIPPVIVDSAGNVLDGHHRVEAARRLGYEQVPVIEKFDRQSGPKFGDEYAEGGAVHMQDGGAAFGVFPQAKPRRSRQDREAAKNVPVDLLRGVAAGALGMPGDIESLARLPYELITGKESKTILPTSEEIEKRLPFRSDTPASRAAAGLGQLAGGVYTGPGAPVRLVAGLPGAVKRAGRDFIESAGQTVSPLTVYHGSPHRFEKFDASKIGTGEGAQVYGHGLYFAERKDVAKGYADRLAGPDISALSPKAKKAFNKAADEILKATNNPGLVTPEYTANLAADRATGAVAEELRQYASNPPKAKGNLYTVDLPDEKIARMLDWDKPLSQQSDYVKKVFGYAEPGLPKNLKAVETGQQNPAWKYQVEGFPAAATEEEAIKNALQSMRLSQRSIGQRGEKLYQQIAEKFVSAKNPLGYQEASEELRRMGIPGIRYLDQGSRPVNLTDQKLRNLLEKHQDPQKAVDEMMLGVYETPKQKEKMRQEFLRQLEGFEPQTRNFVVFPGEEDALTILERKKKGGEVGMKKGGEVKDEDKPFIGYRRAGRRPESQQSRQAAADVPVAAARGIVSGVLGAPGDIESLVRMLPGFDEKTILPTSEDIAKRLPLASASDSPAGRAATGLGQIGGGFYMGPGAPLRLVGALPGAVKRAGQDFAMAAGQPAVNVIKPKGGNWLTGNVEKQVGRMKMSDNMTPEYYADRQHWLEEARAKGDDRAVRAISEELEVSRRNDAINNWIDRNLTNYIKKEMATPEDPVRRLAEEGILHIKPFGDQGVVSSRLQNKRMSAGFSPVGEGKSEAAKFWERQADISIDPYPAGSYKHGTLDERLLEANPWLKNVPDEQMINYAKGINDLGFDHIVDVLRQDVRAGRIRPEQLSKVSMEQAVRRTAEFDEEMAKKMREAQIKATEGMPVYKEYPEGYKWVELTKPKDLPSNYTVADETGMHGFESPYFVVKDETGKPVADGNTKETAISSALETDPRLQNALKYEGETMGHCVGGYCPDVAAGRSRIFSLRDAKGEPHVTVETKPARISPYEFYHSKEAPQSLIDRITELEKSGKDFDWEQVIRNSPEYRALPNSIVQIKGKQNRAPKEEYLPFVQDFVRSGNWSDVGDIKNTGLYRKSNFIDEFTPEQLDAVGQGEYLTMDEIRKLREGKDWKPIDTDPELDINIDGMKKGGAVKSDCGCETKMAAGGLAAKLKGLLNAGAKASDRAAAGQKAADVAKATAPMRMSEAIGSQNLEGKGKLKVTQTDRTKVGDGNIGGAFFSALQHVDPFYADVNATWGVGKPSTAQALINRSDENTLWSTIIMGPDQLKTNPIVFNKLRRGFTDAMREGKLSDELAEKINTNLKLMFGDKADIRDPRIWQKADTFEKRALLADVMMGKGMPPSKGGVSIGGEKSGKGVIFKPTEILTKESEPMLLHPEYGGTVPTFSVGPRLFTLSDEYVHRPDLHPGFPYIIKGEDKGLVYTPAPGPIALRDYTNTIKERYGANPGYFEYTMGKKDKKTGQTLFPEQDITDEWLTFLQKEGYAKGGKVKSGLSAIEKV